MNGAELLVAALENEGVREIFGFPGEENLDDSWNPEGALLRLARLGDIDPPNVRRVRWRTGTN
jgi:hypothetical protein